MKIDQLAYYCRTPEAETKVKMLLGLSTAEWVKDTVTSLCEVWGQKGVTNIAELQFNYSLGIELEIIRYTHGPHWLQAFEHNPEPFVGHVGLHLDEGEPFPMMPGCRLVQEAFTLTHTAPHLVTGEAAGRKYHYKIFELSGGQFIKYIRRRHPGQE